MNLLYTSFVLCMLAAERCYAFTVLPNNHHDKLPSSFPSVIKKPITAALYSTVETKEKDATKLSPPNSGDEIARVQRIYQTYDWVSPATNLTHSINYRVDGDPTTSKPPILLVHGFGANINHFRYNFPLLVEEGHRVVAIDLLGFGASDKPSEEEYSIELWMELLCDFIRDKEDEIMMKKRSSYGMNGYDEQKWIIGGNSIGGLCSLGVAKTLPDKIQGCVLFNAAGGMTARPDYFPFLLRPIAKLFFQLIRGPLGTAYFQNFKTRDNVYKILAEAGVYGNTSNVNEELLEILLGPSDDEGAQDVFLKVLTGDAGPTPEALLEEIKCPVLALWGSKDPWTPVDSGFHPGNGFAKYAKQCDFELVVLEGAGHCPHDECPELIHEKMVPWLRKLN